VRRIRESAFRASPPEKRGAVRTLHSLGVFSTSQTDGCRADSRWTFFRRKRSNTINLIIYGPFVCIDAQFAAYGS